jgi:hypothetical protein
LVALPHQEANNYNSSNLLEEEKNIDQTAQHHFKKILKIN